MSKGRVLVIDDDEWVCRLLAVAMKEAGFEISITENAADGFYRAVEEQPDCIVCDVDLPDHNGYWVVKKIRAHPSSIATAPFVFLSGLDDREHRLEGFHVGGDAYLTKPFRIDEVVAQVDALIQMAARLRKARQTLGSIPPPHAAMSGDLGQMSAGTLLTLLDLERRSGTLELRSESHKALIVIVNGNVVGTIVDEVSKPALDAVRRALTWSVGKFAFTPSPPADDKSTTATATPINALLMEAARLEDEERAGEGRPSSTRIASWKESIARGTPRPFSAASSAGSTPSQDLSLFTPRPPPATGAPPSSPEPSSAPRSSDVPLSFEPLTPFPPPSPTPGPTTASPPPASVAPMNALATPLAPPVAPIAGRPSPSPAIPSFLQSIPERETTTIEPLSAPAPTVPAAGARPPGDRASPLLPGMPRSPAGTMPRTPSPNAAGAGIKPPSPFAPKPLVPKPPNLLPAPNRPLPTASGTSSTAGRPPKPPLPVPRTAFGALRSLSPSRGIRAVSPSPPVVAPPPPPPPSESGADSVDAGWSSPPGSSDDEDPFLPSDPKATPKDVK